MPLRLIVVFVLFLISSSEGQASSVIARGGEHADFTRLTFAFDSKLDKFWFSEPEGEAFLLIKTANNFEKLDLSRAFTRLSQGRISKIEKIQSGIAIYLSCKCKGKIMKYNDFLLVLDISEINNSGETVAKRKDMFSNRSERSLSASTSETSVKLPDLNFSVVDRLSREMANSIKKFDVSLSKHLAPLPSSDNPRDERSYENHSLFRNERSGEVENSEIPAEEDSCVFFDSLIRAIVDPDYQESPFETSSTVVDGLGEQQLLKLAREYFAMGLLEEARVVLVSAEASQYDLALFQSLEGKLALDGAYDNYKLPNCNALTTLIRTESETSNAGFSEVSNDEIIEMSHFLNDVSVGLLLRLYPLLKNHRVGSLTSGFDHLIFDKKASIDRYFEGAVNSRRIYKNGMTLSDPEENAAALAAVSVEQRDTRFEKESWLASFEAYLSADQMVAALETLRSGPKLDAREFSVKSTIFAKALAETSDVLTFLEIVLGKLDDVEQSMEREGWLSISERIIAEGFGDAALVFLKRYPFDQSESGFRLTLAEALLLVDRPEESEATLSGLTGEKANELRSRARLEMGDFSQQFQMRVDSGAEIESIQSDAWMSGNLPYLVGTESPFAEVSALLQTERGVPSAASLKTVQGARAALEKSTESRVAIEALLE